MPPLGELVDAGLRGDLDDYDLTVAFRGLERQYGPYHVKDVAAWHEGSWIYDDGRFKPAEVSFTCELRDADGRTLVPTPTAESSIGKHAS
jgi:hypothetical protein